MKDNSIIICDDQGDIRITYEEILKYHGQDYYGGVALALKVLQLGFSLLLGEQVPHRNKIRIVVGFDPPGVMDAIEFVTRAQTRRHLTVDPEPPKGPDSVFGKYYFEVHYENQKVNLWLKPGILPDDFTMLARKAFAGIADSHERARWTEYKKKIGDHLLTLEPADILDFDEPFQQEC